MAHSRPQSVADKICDSRGGAVTPSLNSRIGLFGRLVKGAINLEMEDTRLLTGLAVPITRKIHQQT